MVSERTIPTRDEPQGATRACETELYRVILALDEWTQVFLVGSSSEPERRAKALRSFAEEKEPGLLERLQEGEGRKDIRAPSSFSIQGRLRNRLPATCQFPIGRLLCASSAP